MDTQTKQDTENNALAPKLQPLQAAVQLALIHFPAISERCSKAVVALSQFQTIEDDATDEKANKFLVKTKEIYEDAKEKRMQFTGPMDDFKAIAMEPEKSISTDANATNSAYNRVKNLRNVYANKKLADAEAKRKQIEHQRKKVEELNHLDVAFDKAAFDSVTTHIITTDKKFEDFFLSLTVDNIDTESEKLKVTPKFPQAIYEALFNLPYNGQLISTEEFEAEKKKAKQKFTYESVNKDFVDRVTPKTSVWFGKIPERKAQLIALKEAQAADAAKAEQLKKQQEEQQAEENRKRQEALAKEMEEQSKAKETELAAKEDDLKNEAMFVAQAAEQVISDPSGTMSFQATITAAEEDLIIAISELFFKVFIHPKFTGIIKREGKNGPLKYDENGRPVYEDWVEKLLDFYANNCEHTIPGITCKKVVKTVQRKTK